MKHKLIVFFVTSLLSFSLVAPLIPVKVHAQQTISPKEEYKIWRSYTLVKECLDDNFSDPTAESSEKDVLKKIFAEDKSTNAGGLLSFSDVIDDDPGKWFTESILGLDSADFGCGVEDDIYPALAALGFGGIDEFAEFVNNDNFKEGGRIQTEEGSALENALKDLVKSKGVRLGLDKIADFQYWYFKSIFEAKESEGGCGGLFQNSPTNTNRLPGSFYVVNSGGEVVERSYANYSKDAEGDGSKLYSLDDVMTRVMDNGSPTCEEIAKEMTKERAEAFAEWRKNASTEALQAESSESAENQGSDDGSQGPSCEESADSPLAWITCPLLAGVEEVVNWLFDFADSLLNIEAQQLYEDDGLRTAWSYFRVIATLGLLGVGLAMVISQIVGGNG